MDNIYNKEIDRWIKPWNIQKFDDISIRDERFFSIVIKGFLGFMNRTILMYDKPIKHFIFNTGSSYLYVESNGYELNFSETTGEDQMYMEMPRCICEVGNFEIQLEDLTNPYIRGTYERRSSITGQYQGYNAEMRRVPINISLTLRYVLSNFNESIILIQEFIDKMIFQKYYTVNYLGQKIQCSIEFPTQNSVNINRIDFDSTETNQKNIEMSVSIDTYYPVINERTEIKNSKIIASADYNIDIVDKDNEVIDNSKYNVN